MGMERAHRPESLGEWVACGFSGLGADLSGVGGVVFKVGPSRSNISTG